jgi:site-specific recombinase XerD
MRTTAIYNIVFNRMKKKLAPGDKGLIQIEILFQNNKKKYVGVTHVLEKEWDAKRKEVVNTPISGRLNNEIQEKVRDIRNYEMKLLERGFQLTPAEVDKLLHPESNKGNFVQFMRREVNLRRTIHVKTRSRHLLMADILEELGIVEFSQLTYANVLKLDQHLKNQGMEQTTIHKKHQFFNTYIILAEKMGILDPTKNPYNNFENKKGKSKLRVRLDDSEIEKICTKEITGEPLNLCRDIYVFQMFTGLSYTDLQHITYSQNIKHQDDGVWIEGLRRKDGENYSIYLVQDAIDILEKYKVLGRDLVFDAPHIKTQNQNLKIVASIVGINKVLTTHTARHTAATLMIRKGMPLEYISSVLGHTQLETTRIYAKLEKPELRKQMMKITRQI